ncbi:putative sugar phosphate/phosphate translocator [Camellia lanceoleosa]|uniref:Sugar phosphate/phosphate translocator n=1 Tax=Camellia lanceoleosa TaxID=1840588 RepID=A0ACC0G5V6_9ERIC|nr:putative sugar phosphate/phosphate translocator [Camellia lanceoleosa]
MLKAIMPVAVFILGVATGLEMMSCRMLLIISVISFGVLVVSYEEIDINWIGVIYQMGALLFADTMLTMINLFGYGIAITGVAAYNNHKLKNEASRGSSDDESQHAESTPLTSSSITESR